jgi:hypothetical protein
MHSNVGSSMANEKMVGGYVWAAGGENFADLTRPHYAPKYFVQHPFPFPTPPSQVYQVSFVNDSTLIFK